MWTITYFDMLSLTCYSMLTMSTFKNWPYATMQPIVYYYRDIQLYPVIDSSTWPFPIREQNAVKFMLAMEWLQVNNIDMMGSRVDYTNHSTQTVILKFTSEEDVTAFTLMFGELL